MSSPSTEAKVAIVLLGELVRELEMRGVIDSDWLDRKAAAVRQSDLGEEVDDVADRFLLEKL